MKPVKIPQAFSLKHRWFRYVARSKKMIRETVKVPETLIEKLKPFGPRFIKVSRPLPGDRKSGKNAVEHGFINHPCDAEGIQEWLDEGGNYGVLFGEGLAGIDMDDPQTYHRFAEKVETFTVQTGRGPEGIHVYIRTNVIENGILLDSEGKTVGNIQARNKYTVGPGSNHYTGGKYRILKDGPIAWVSKKDLEEIFGERLVWTGQRLRKTAAQQAREESKLAGIQIPIDQIVDFKELRQLSLEEWQGPHPVHGSTTGQNFCVNKVKNCWHCFRCNSGGGPLSWLAVKHGLIKCHQAQKGVLRGELFLKTIEFARYEGFDIELEDQPDESLSPKVSKYFEAAKFIPSFLAKELMERHHYVTRKDDKTIFVYHPEKGIYTPDGETCIIVETKELLGKHYRRNRQNEVLNDIIASTLQDAEEPPPHLLALKNGILDLKTNELKEFNPEYFILNALPVKYDPDARCPRILEVISEIVDEEDIPVLQEISGYCLYRNYSIHKAFMFVGEGSNGKSTFMTLLIAMLGLENISTQPLQALEQRFAVVALHGKLANICSDLSDKALRKTGLFKMLTGGDTISAEYKFKETFTFKNYAKLVFSANKIPETKDDTTAFFRRWIIINFPNQFLPDNPKTDVNLTEKLTTEEEMSGFFNWALKGLKRLLKNGRFSTGKSVEETREQYIRASDPVKAFVMDSAQFKAGSILPKDEVYKAFIKYCQEMKLPTVAKNVFSMKLQEHMPRITETTKQIRGKRVRCWRDIAITKERENADIQENAIDLFEEALSHL